MSCCRGVKKLMCKCPWRAANGCVCLEEPWVTPAALAAADFVRRAAPEGRRYRPLILRAGAKRRWETDEPSFTRFLPTLYDKLRQPAANPWFRRRGASEWDFADEAHFWYLDALIEYAVTGTVASVPSHLVRASCATFADLLEFCDLPLPMSCPSCSRKIWPCAIQGDSCCLCTQSDSLCATPSICWKIQPVEGQRMVLLRETPVPDINLVSFEEMLSQIVELDLSQQEINKLASLLQQVANEAPPPDTPPVATATTSDEFRTPPPPKSPKASKSKKAATTEPGAALQKTSMCTNYRRGNCQRNDDCKFAHSLQELRGTADKFKTKICAFWAVGSCKAGNACRHAHGVDELHSQVAIAADSSNAQMMLLELQRQS